jgi:transposase-like protein
MVPNKFQATHQTTMPPRKVYTREFKQEALRLLKSSGKTKTELERELGLYQGQLHLWEKAFNFNKVGGNLEQAFPGTGHQNDAEAELRQLRRENEILRHERNILKKQ